MSAFKHSSVTEMDESGSSLEVELHFLKTSLFIRKTILTPSFGRSQFPLLNLNLFIILVGGGAKSSEKK